MRKKVWERMTKREGRVIGYTHYSRLIVTGSDTKWEFSISKKSHALCLPNVGKLWLHTFLSLGLLERSEDFPPVLAFAPTNVTLQGETGRWTSISESSESELEEGEGESEEEEEDAETPFEVVAPSEEEAPPVPPNKITPGSWNKKGRYIDWRGICGKTAFFIFFSTVRDRD